MNSCKSIRELIDEADNPNLLPFEVSQHVDACRDCERFSAERAGLRNLLGSGVRVAAPMNFDAMLAARLAETRNRGWLSWLAPASYFRLGAATASVAALVLVAQYSGLFSSNVTPPRQQDAIATTSKQPERIPSAQPVPDAGIVADNRRQPQRVTPIVMGARISSGRLAAAAIGRVRPREAVSSDDLGVVLVRGQNGGSDVQMPTVSLGAQPLLYVSAGKQQPVRNVGASF
ncbi:MAG TPA: hypothetical protein VN743_13560 [Blastocatellia bacterium]|jgi:hypothetical protein|nr:hypothetical protein [Blastocatellia bacterium]